MQFETLFRAAAERPVRAALLGAGEFGLSLIAQARRMRGLRITAALDRDPARVAAALAAAGVPHRRCASAAEARAAEAAGELALLDGIDDLLALPARHRRRGDRRSRGRRAHALAAIAAGIGVAMVSKEAECVVGPLLAARARAGRAPLHAGRWRPAGAADRPRLLGADARPADRRRRQEQRIRLRLRSGTGTARWLEQAGRGAGDRRALGAAGDDRPRALAARATALAALPQRTVPDCCEMALVANATGADARPDFHAPLARTTELPDIYGPRATAACWSADGVLDVFNCLRRPDEASFAGGVFVVVDARGRKTGELFAGKGIPVSRDRRRALIYNPSHLLGVEAPISVMAAARLGHPWSTSSYRQRHRPHRARRRGPAGRTRSRDRGQPPRRAGPRRRAAARRVRSALARRCPTTWRSGAARPPGGGRCADHARRSRGAGRQARSGRSGRRQTPRAREPRPGVPAWVEKARRALCRSSRRQDRFHRPAAVVSTPPAARRGYRCFRKRRHTVTSRP